MGVGGGMTANSAFCWKGRDAMALRGKYGGRERLNSVTCMIDLSNEQELFEKYNDMRENLRRGGMKQS